MIAATTTSAEAMMMAMVDGEIVSSSPAPGAGAVVHFLGGGRSILLFLEIDAGEME